VGLGRHPRGGQLLHPIYRLTIAGKLADNVALGAAPILSISIASSEPDNAIGSGSGNTVGDTNGADGYFGPGGHGPVAVPLPPFQLASGSIAAGTFATTVLLRAEREGTNPVGRTYTMTVRASDAAGNPTAATIAVVVPQSQGG
jgi:hypothetical protein